jgi:hypothetical protein
VPPLARGNIAAPVERRARDLLGATFVALNAARVRSAEHARLAILVPVAGQLSALGEKD